jgi:hypothetical protein
MPSMNVSDTNGDQRPEVEDSTEADSSQPPLPSLLLNGTNNNNVSLPSIPPKATPYVIIHRVECNGHGGEGEDHHDHPVTADFFDVPQLFTNDTRGTALHGQHTLPPYYETPPESYMTVYRLYSCTEYHKQIKDSFKILSAGIDKRLLSRMRPFYYMLQSDGPLATMSGEEIVFSSESFSDAMKAIVSSKQDELPDWRSDRNLRAPYDYFYHFRHFLRDQSALVLSGRDLDMVHVLLTYIDETQGPTFDKVDATFAAGNVHKKDFAKLFRPNGLVTTVREGYARAYIAEKSSLYDPQMLRLSCWTWMFDGSFRKKPEALIVPWPDPRAEEVPIDSLVAKPLRLDKSGLEQRLEERGKSFWSCRHRKFVSYDAPAQTIFELQTVCYLHFSYTMHPSRATTSYAGRTKTSLSHFLSAIALLTNATLPRPTQNT